MTNANSSLEAEKPDKNARIDQPVDLGSLLKSTDIAVIFLDANFCIRLVTPAVKNLFEVIPSDLGRPLADLPRKFNDSELLSDAQTVLEKTIHLEKEVVSKNGRFYVRRILPYRDVDNCIKGVVITFTDIGVHKLTEINLRKSEDQYRLIFEGLKDYAIFMLNREGQVASWNSGAERMLKYKQHEVIGQSLGFIFSQYDREAGKPAMELHEARKNGSITQEGWRLRKDGVRFWGVGTLTALMDDTGELRGFVKVLRDYTDHKLTEEALKQATLVAETANTAKDHFLANISHELRTPLGAIVLWINLLEEEGVFDPEKVQATLAAIKKCAEEQGKLIEDLVDTSRIVAGKFRLDMRETELLSVIKAAIESVRPSATEKGVKIEKKLDPKSGTVNVDPSRIQQVIWNLLNNAIKFTPAGGRIGVEVQRHGNDVEIRVTDTGQGISPEFLPHVFDRFGQAEQAGIVSNLGMGLGLSIAKQIIEMHSGTITAESGGLGRGATFFVWLPLPKIFSLSPSVPEKANRQKLSKKLSGQHVFVLEDTTQTLKALVAILQKADAKVTALESAHAALEAFGRQRPDLIVSDLGLPEIDGYQFISKIRGLEKSMGLPSVPALALTAFAGKNVSSKALKSGFQMCLTKPIQAQTLVSVLASLRTESDKI